MARPIIRIGVAVITCYLTWLGMLLVHELGHVLAAWLSGGRVIAVSLPLLGFSETIVHPNPHEVFVVCGGPVFGTLAPLAVLFLYRVMRRKIPQFVRFFAGFCCVANGAYIGLGWTRRAGDTGDMLRLGVPAGAMIGFGATAVVAGLICWHYTLWIRLSYWRATSS